MNGLLGRLRQGAASLRARFSRNRGGGAPTAAGPATSRAGGT